MNVPQWIGGLFGIQKTAESIVLKSETFLVMDPMASGNAEEKSRPVTIHMAKEDMNGSVDVVVYWTKTLKEIFKKEYKDQKSALHAYSEIVDTLKEIDEMINDGYTEKAKKASDKILETLELDGKKNELSLAIEKETSIIVDGVGMYRAASKDNAIAGFEFDDAFIEKAFKPACVVNVLPSYFLNNTPTHIYSTYTKPHIAKENYTAMWYGTITTDDGKLNNVAVMERAKGARETYYIIENCSEDKFIKLCRLVTPTYEDFNLKFENGKVTRLASNTVYETKDKNALVDEFMKWWRKSNIDMRFLPHHINEFANKNNVKPEELADDIKAAVKTANKEDKPRQYATMNLDAALSVEAKGNKKERNMLPETNVHSSGKDEWRLDQGAQRPTEEAISFYTPLIVGFNSDVATYDIQFENGIRTNLNVDAVKSYLYNAGFTYKDVDDILEDAKKNEVVVYGKKHKKAADMANEITSIMKFAESEDNAIGYVESLPLDDAEKKDIKAMIRGFYKSAIETPEAKKYRSEKVKKNIEEGKDPDQAVAIAYSQTAEKFPSANKPKKQASESILVEAANILKKNPNKIITFARLVDEYYRNDIIKKELYDKFYKLYRAALNGGTDDDWNTLAKAAEMIYNQMCASIEKSAAIDQAELEHGIEIETKEHKVPEVVGAGIAAQHLMEHENYYDKNDGLKSFEKSLDAKSKEDDNGEKADD